MKTTLVNRHNTRRFETSIGRDSIFGNPHRIGYCSICKRVHDRVDCLKAYRIYFYKRLLTDEDFRVKINGLKGKVLGCWCVPDLCHGHIIIEYLENEPYEFERTNNIETTDFFCDDAG